jgi:hypothetical protein
MLKNVAYITGILVIFATGIIAQTTINPDISVIGDFQFHFHNDSSRPVDKEKLVFHPAEMEAMFSGYLNPYARADAVLAWHGEHNAELEEIYATFLRGLPFGLNFRAGKYLLEFGRLNPVHPHAYSFINRPLPHEEFFGEHGLNDLALRLSYLAPIPGLYTELMAAALKGDALQSHHHDEEGDAEEEAAESEEESYQDPGFLGRLALSFGLDESAELAAGASILTTLYDPHDKLRATIAGIDFKCKWKPNRYRSLVLEAEGLLNDRQMEGGEKATSFGGYGYLDYRFRQKYNVGLIYEYTEGALDETTNKWRTAFFIGFAPVEETSLARLIISRNKETGLSGYWTAVLQLVISLGPHQPHNF